MTCRVTEEALANYRVHASSGRVVIFDTETTGISRDMDDTLACGSLFFNLMSRVSEPGGYICEPVE